MNKARADKRFRETKAQSDARGVRTLIHETTHPRDDGRSQNQARAEPKQHRVRYSVCADKNTGTRVHSDTEKQRVVQTNSQHSKEIHYRLITTKSPEEYHPEAMARFATGGRLRAVVGDGSSRPFGCASCSSGVLLVEGGGEVDLRCGNVREADAATRWDSIAGGLETPHIERDSLEELDLETDVLETCEIEANRNGVPHFSNATRRPYTGRATTMGINPYPEYVTHETPECHATPAVQQVHSQMLFQPQDGRVEMLRGEAVVRSSSGSAVCAVSHPMQASHQLPWENNIQGLPATIRTSFSESDICMPNALLEKEYNRVTRESLEAEGITYDGSKTSRSDGKWPAVIPLAETPERDLARQKIGVPLDPHGRAGTTDDPVKENSFTMLDDVSTSKQSSAVTSTSKANMSTTVKRAPERRTSHAGVTARKDFVKMNVMSLGRTDEGKTSYLNMYRKVQKLKQFERAESEHENLHNTNAKSNENSAIVTRSDEGDGGETKMEGGGGKKCLKGLNLEFEENDCSKTEEFKKQHGEGKNFQSADAFGKKTLRDEDEDEKEEEEKSTVGAKKTSASISPSNSGTSTSQIKDCSFKQYTLHDYRLLDLQINLGRLDPEPCDVNEHDRLQRRKDYGREIKIRNQEELSLSKGSTCTFGKQPQVQVSRRRQALSYAKTVPLPKAGKGCARGEWVLNRIPTDSILERGSHLDVLHRRHEHEKSIVAKFGRMI